MEPGQYIRLLKSNQAEIDSFCKENEFLYRYLPLERFLEVMQKKQLAFASPSLWNDPFDNLLFRQPIKNDKSFLKNIFAGCFTLTPHSQAYWKTYATEGYSIRIKVKSKEFISLLSKLDCKVWLGKLIYIKEKTFIEKLQNTVNLKKTLEGATVNDTFLQLFHLKRIPFEYEKEVRFIFEASSTKDNLKRIDIKLSDIIQDIYLDPYMGTSETKAWKEYLSQYKIKVIKSLLFKNKKIDIK